MLTIETNIYYRKKTIFILHRRVNNVFMSIVYVRTLSLTHIHTLRYTHMSTLQYTHLGVLKTRCILRMMNWRNKYVCRDSLCHTLYSCSTNSTNAWNIIGDMYFLCKKCFRFSIYSYHLLTRFRKSIINS